jgi:hypothetical protein
VDSRRLIAGLLLVATTTVVSGCGGGGKATPAGGGSSPAIPRPGQAVADVKRNWTEFFDGSTPAARRISLLENGEKFAELIDALSTSPLTKQVKARVSAVKVTEQGTATVTYTLFFGGKSALPSATGTAVLVNGTWKVGVDSFCRLLALQGVVPQACPSAGK